MREQIKYNDREIIITAYSGAIERDLVMYKFSRDDETPPKLKDLIFILQDCVKSNIPLNHLSESEIFYIFYSLRALSVSNGLPMIMDCPNCGKHFETTIDLSGILKEGKIDNPKLKDIYSENFDDYFKDVESLEMEEYDDLLNYIESNRTTFNFTKKIHCKSCTSEHALNLFDINLLTSSMSNFDIAGFYKSLNSLVYFGHYSISDLLNDVLPFERELITTLIQNEIEKADEIRKGKSNGRQSIFK